MRIIFLLPLLAIGCAGGKGATCGWRFEMGKAGEMYTNIPYQQTSGNLGIAPVGAIGLDSHVAVGGMTRIAVGEEVAQVPAAAILRPAASTRVTAQASDCTMQEICDLLRAIAAKQGIRAQDARPMPKSNE